MAKKDNNQKKICIIVGAGDFDGLYHDDINRDSFIIAADGGYSYLKELGIAPDMWIGDSDSINEVPVLKEGCIKVDLPVEKDDTDVLAAIKYALNREYDCFHIYGVTGGRLDHTIANIKILSYISSIGKEGYIFSPAGMITVIENGSLCFDETCDGTISVFALKDICSDVTIKGLKYEIENASLTQTDSIGVSNAFIHQKSIVSVGNGRLLVMLQKLPNELPQRG